jgi:hypothetical protein
LIRILKKPGELELAGFTTCIAVPEISIRDTFRKRRPVLKSVSYFFAHPLLKNCPLPLSPNTIIFNMKDGGEKVYVKLTERIKVDDLLAIIFKGNIVLRKVVVDRDGMCIEDIKGHVLKIDPKDLIIIGKKIEVMIPTPSDLFEVSPKRSFLLP